MIQYIYSGGGDSLTLDAIQVAKANFAETMGEDFMKELDEKNATITLEFKTPVDDKTGYTINLPNHEVGEFIQRFNKYLENKGG
ncbi:MAG: hypothetical protein JNM14_16390 [Ferruginibacter sp.]|nr:hypothetical protein [Ferruginibacter sp.]